MENSSLRSCEGRGCWSVPEGITFGLSGPEDHCKVKYPKGIWTSVGDNRKSSEIRHQWLFFYRSQEDFRGVLGQMTCTQVYILVYSVQICMWNCQQTQSSFGENVMSREILRKSFSVERKIIEKLIFNCPEDGVYNH